MSFIRKVKRNIAVKESGLTRGKYFMAYHRSKKDKLQKELEQGVKKKHSLLARMKDKLTKKDIPNLPRREAK